MSHGGISGMRTWKVAAMEDHPACIMTMCSVHASSSVTSRCAALPMTVVVAEVSAEVATGIAPDGPADISSCAVGLRHGRSIRYGLCSNGMRPPVGVLT